MPNDPAAPLANDTAAPLGSAALPVDSAPGDVLAEQGVQEADAVGVLNPAPSVSATRESSTGPGTDRSASDHGVFIDWFGDGSVAVVDLALACCAVESELAAPLDAPRTAQPSSGAKVVAVVSGTLTDALAPTVRDAVAALPDPFVVAFGGCACIGGPYWDSYSVTKGVDQLMPVDAFVPGCPPPPGALDEVVRAVRANSFHRAEVRAS